MSLAGVLAFLLSVPASAQAPAPDQQSVVQAQAQEQPRDPGSPSGALESFNRKPDAEEAKHLSAANPDPMSKSLLLLAGGGAALVVPFLAWMVFRRMKGEDV